MTEQLERLSSELAFREFAQRYPFVEPHEALIEEWVDYYTPDVVGIDTFRAEFTADELDRIVSFVDYLHDATSHDARHADWPAIRAKAAELLASLSTG